MDGEAQPASEHPSEALRLPPRFLTDHCLRTLYYSGPLSPLELAAQWHIPTAVAVSIVEVAKSAGVVEGDVAQSTFEQHARVRLTAAGREQLNSARQKTWYSGAVPVSVPEFSERAGRAVQGVVDRPAMHSALAELGLTDAQADELGQCAVSNDVVAITGAASDEQPTIARAVAGALQGDVELPYAIFAAGNVIRVFDPRHHQDATHSAADRDELDVMRVRRGEMTPWTRIGRPYVSLAGGVLMSDVTPPFDDDARFYLAPPPLLAFGGVLAVFDADADPGHLADLTRLWLMPGKHGAGILLLRSGERIELPWRATTLLFAWSAAGLRESARSCAYHVELAPLEQAMLRHVLARRLSALPLNPQIIEALASGLEQRQAATRTAAADAARYLLDATAYRAASLGFDEAVRGAVSFAAERPGRPGLRAA